MFEWVSTTRPSVTWLENVPEIKQGYEIAGVTTSDAEYIIMKFKGINMTCIHIDFDSQTKGSAKAHDRTAVFCVAMCVLPLLLFVGPVLVSVRVVMVGMCLLQSCGCFVAFLLAMAYFII